MLNLEIMSKAKANLGAPYLIDKYKDINPHTIQSIRALFSINYSSPPPFRVARLAQGGEVDGRRLLKECILGGCSEAPL